MIAERMGNERANSKTIERWSAYLEEVNSRIARFGVRTELEGLVRCNCSLCARRSAVMHYVTPSDFTLISGEERLATYRFGSRTAAHHFYKVRGVFPFFLSDWGGQQHHGVNVACLEGVDPYEQETTLIDGKSF